LGGKLRDLEERSPMGWRTGGRKGHTKLISAETEGKTQKRGREPWVRGHIFYVKGATLNLFEGK